MWTVLELVTTVCMLMEDRGALPETRSLILDYMVNALVHVRTSYSSWEAPCS